MSLVNTLAALGLGSGGFAQDALATPPEDPQDSALMKLLRLISDPGTPYQTHGFQGDPQAQRQAVLSDPRVQFHQGTGGLTQRQRQGRLTVDLPAGVPQGVPQGAAVPRTGFGAEFVDRDVARRLGDDSPLATQDGRRALLETIEQANRGLPSLAAGRTAVDLAQLNRGRRDAGLGPGIQGLLTSEGLGTQREAARLLKERMNSPEKLAKREQRMANYNQRQGAKAQAASQASLGNMLNNLLGSDPKAFSTLLGQQHMAQAGLAAKRLEAKQREQQIDAERKAQIATLARDYSQLHPNATPEESKQAAEIMYGNTATAHSPLTADFTPDQLSQWETIFNNPDGAERSGKEILARLEELLGQSVQIDQAVQDKLRSYAISKLPFEERPEVEKRAKARRKVDKEKFLYPRIPGFLGDIDQGFTNMIIGN